jgi:2-polyprenyl-3-methyl-5-hydroxy-6-metoxy-1,4-benzoquinol methylase
VDFPPDSGDDRHASGEIMTRRPRRNLIPAFKAKGGRLSPSRATDGIPPALFPQQRVLRGVHRRLDLKGKSVADVGTGSGILALAAARAGAASVLAVDINPNAVLSAEENAQSNGFGDRVSAAYGSSR